MIGLAHLREAAPVWAALLAEGRARSDWLAAPPLPSGTPVPAHVVTVVWEDGYLSVSEREPGTRLPTRCPELHIVANSSFCLGLRDYRVDSRTDAEAFWQDLGEFLVNQHHAARRGRWPVGRWLSHGSYAAKLQLTAERVAATLGVASDYSACLENDDGWIADLVRSDKLRVRPSEVCPLGCRKGADGPASLRHCGHLEAVRRIIATERKRRSAQLSHYRMLQHAGVNCCGRVPHCPLNQRVAA
jgi:hypothetical protein